METPQFVYDFANIALHNAVRGSLSGAEFLPVPEAILVSVGENDALRGARVYFEPPVKAVWVGTNYAPSTVFAEDTRKKDTPLSDTYYVYRIIKGVIDYDTGILYSPPAAE